MPRRAAARTAYPSRAAARLPARFDAQLATLVAQPPAGDEWVHEIKFDGYRIAARVQGEAVTLISRNGKDWTAHFPEVCAAARQLPVHTALLDGEVAVELPDGRTSFQALQNALGGQERRNLVYFVFDLLHLDGEDVARLPLETRKAKLQHLIERRRAQVIRYADHVVGNGPEFLRQACRHGLEGIVSKRRDRPYEPGRGGGWLKAKCIKRQELVIGGFTDPEGSRAGLGALLVGVHDAGGRLVFSGKVGTGFTQQSARELRARLEQLEQNTCPFDPPPAGWLGRHAHWVKPSLVAEVAFTEWTADGKIRHPSFQGLRADKPAPDVVREQPSNAPTSRRSRADDPVMHGVNLTHPERVLFPDVHITKLDLARFYDSIAEWIVPHLAGRPLTLVRCPEAVGRSCFFMKHSRVWAPPGLRRVHIREKKKVGEYLVADSMQAVIALVQMDVLEIHTWNSRLEHVEQPDRIVLDLDPGPEVRWPQVIEAARLLRTALRAVGLESFVKNTGGNGLHVVVPLEPHADWTDCLEFARIVAETVAEHDASRYTTAFAKAGRERKILIDYLRNNRTNTSIAAFSTRAKARAPVSVPLAWDELSARVPSNHYTVHNLPKRLAGLRHDPWQAYWRLKQRLTPAMVGRVEQLKT